MSFSRSPSWIHGGDRYKQIYKKRQFKLAQRCIKNLVLGLTGKIIQCLPNLAINSSRDNCMSNGVNSSGSNANTGSIIA